MTITRKVGLALGSGGVRGLVHIGIIKTLLKHKIPIDYISGTSIGAWVGAHYALYKDIDKLEELTIGRKKEKLLSFLELAFGGGLIKGEKLEKLLSKWLNNSDFGDLKIPLTIVAADLVKGEQFLFNAGKLALAVRASTAIPGIFRPIRHGNKILIDGGVCNPVPADIVRKMGADVVIAINLDRFQLLEGFTKKDFDLDNIALRAMKLMRHYLAEQSIRGADFVIQPNLAQYSSWRKYFTSDTGKEMVKIGEKEIEKIMPALKQALI